MSTTVLNTSTPKVIIYLFIIREISIVSCYHGQGFNSLLFQPDELGKDRFIES